MVRSNGLVRLLRMLIKAINTQAVQLQFFASYGQNKSAQKDTEWSLAIRIAGYGLLSEREPLQANSQEPFRRVLG